MKIILGALFSFLAVAFLFSHWIDDAKSPSESGIPLPIHPAPDESGLNNEKLAEFTEHLQKNSDTTGMIVLFDGKVIYEYGNVSEVSYIASCRKSVLSILYGKHIETGRIDLNETIGSLDIDEDDKLLPIEKLATIEHLLSSRSGVFHIPSNDGYDEKNILERGSVRPGTYFVYNNWDFNVAGHVFELKTGNSIYRELEEQIAIPLGFEDWDIQKQKKGGDLRKSRYPAYHIYISTRDMAKIGQLMLNEGMWNGQQIVSREWVLKTTAPVVPAEVVNQREGLDASSPVQFSYGYMWWIFENLYGLPDVQGAYTASGAGGQFITVIPRRKLVIAHKTKLGLLSQIGIGKKGVTRPQYWELLNQLLIENASPSGDPSK